MQPLTCAERAAPSRADVQPSPFIGSRAVRLTAAEVDIYHRALVEDAYQGTGLSVDDFRLYGNAKCRAVLERRQTGSIVVYQGKLEACVAKKKDRFTCSAKLFEWWELNLPTIFALSTCEPELLRAVKRASPPADEVCNYSRLQGCPVVVNA